MGKTRKPEIEPRQASTSAAADELLQKAESLHDRVEQLHQQIENAHHRLEEIHRQVSENRVRATALRKDTAKQWGHKK
ncbi:MAG TPA: hypothetical protein VFU76_05640 [Terriglobales bacterium]|nr:hypothetical protein [Terriglobales bacterium]